MFIFAKPQQFITFYLTEEISFPINWTELPGVIENFKNKYKAEMIIENLSDSDIKLTGSGHSDWEVKLQIGVSYTHENKNYEAEMIEYEAAVAEYTAAKEKTRAERLARKKLRRRERSENKVQNDPELKEKEFKKEMKRHLRAIGFPGVGV